MVAGGTSGQILYNNGGSVQGFTMSGDVTVVPTTGVATVNAPSSHITYTQGGTGATSRTVTSKLQESVSVKDFGAVGDGVTDDTTAIQNAFTAVSTAGGGAIYFPLGTYLISAQITMGSNTSIVCSESAVITTATANLGTGNGGNYGGIFYANAKSNIQWSGGKILQTATGTVAYVAAIWFEGCTYCSVKGVELVGMGWAGVAFSNCSYCDARENYMHGWTGTVQDSADVCVFRASTACVVADNRCYGGGAHGVFVQDPGTSLIPTRNIVIGNRIGTHTTYGIVTYNIDAANTYNQIIGNVIDGIIGTGASGAGGAGIYIQNSGGVTCQGNNIRNCCTGTTSQTLTPAGIGVNNISLANGLIPPTITGNTISDMGGGNNNAITISGINISSSTAGAVVVGNTIRQASGLGTAATTGIFCNASNNLQINGNAVYIDNSISNGSGIFSYANGTNLTNISITNNIISGCTYAGYRFDTNASFTQTDVSLSGNSHSGGGTSCISYRLTRLTQAAVSNNVADTNTAASMTVNNCLTARITGNTLTTTGSLAFTTAGTCTGSYFDKTNYTGTSFTFIQNAATGLIVEYLGSAVPTTSNWAVGDRVEQSVPVVGNPKGWRCTVAGVPGTWVSEGNL